MREYLLGKSSLKNKWFFVFLFVFISCFTFSINSNASAEESVISGGHSQEDLARGERFFKGLLPFDRKYESCVSCHNINHVDTLNWNPSAMDIALKYADKDFASFEQVIMSPSGKKMSEVHKNINIESEDLMKVKSYLNNMAHEGYPHEKVNIVWLLELVSLIIVILWALIELIFLRKIKIKMITVVVLFR